MNSLDKILLKVVSAYISVSMNSILNPYRKPSIEEAILSKSIGMVKEWDDGAKMKVEYFEDVKTGAIVILCTLDDEEITDVSGISLIQTIPAECTWSVMNLKQIKDPERLKAIKALYE